MSGPVYPCPECGAKKGDPHAPSCTRSQRRRKPAPPEPRPGKNYGQPCPPHNPQQIGKPDPEGRYRHRCSKCKKMLGLW